jgi:formate C-acetyltransferase
LERYCGELVRALDLASQCYAEFRPRYLASTMIADCVERGREQQDGGSRYHDYGFAPLGITSAADSLHAIQRAVYEEGFVSAAELLAALRANFAGSEPLRQRLCQVPKYGVDDPSADAMCDHVLTTVCAAAARLRTRFGGRLKPMVFNFVWTPGASRELGAQAHGAGAGDRIGHGMTPRSAAMTAGITAAMRSATSLTYEAVSGGATTMWDLDEEWVDAELMKALLKAFCAQGGMILQGNTTSVRDLEEALVHPERHPDLIVRVGGFSARFVSLDQDLKQEIITRRRHRR